MTTVLITGAGGFLGSHCVEHWLAATDWAIVAVDSFAHRGDIKRLTINARVTPVIANLSHGPVIGTLARYAPDIIVNAASLSHVDSSIADPVTTWINNTGLVLSMLELARACKPHLFIQTSTDEVFGPFMGSTFAGFKEWDAIVPSNPYSASKAAQEALAIAYWRTYGVPIVITNCVNMFGERQHHEKYLAKVAKRLLAGEAVEVHADAAGNIGSRCWTHAKNYAAIVVWLAEQPVPMYACGAQRPARWNVAGQERVSNLDIVNRVAGILGVKPRYTIIDAETARPGHDAHYGLDGAALAAAGWAYPFPLDSSLESTVKWFAANQEWLK